MPYSYVEGQVGDIETALDSIIAVQEKLIGFIEFTISNESYTAVRGMTWAEWCDSKYSPDNASIEDIGVIVEGKLVALEVDGVYCGVMPTDYIIDGATYSE